MVVYKADWQQEETLRGMLKKQSVSPSFSHDTVRRLSAKGWRYFGLSKSKRGNRHSFTLIKMFHLYFHVSEEKKNRYVGTARKQNLYFDSGIILSIDGRKYIYSCEHSPVLAHARSCTQ